MVTRLICVDTLESHHNLLFIVSFLDSNAATARTDQYETIVSEYLNSKLASVKLYAIQTSGSMERGGASFATSFKLP